MAHAGAEERLPARLIHEVIVEREIDWMRADVFRAPAQEPEGHGARLRCGRELDRPPRMEPILDGRAESVRISLDDVARERGDAALRKERRREKQHENEAADQTASTIIAAASPPPMQIAARPRFAPRSCIAWISVTRMRAPLAPIGWPRATAPPFTLIRSCGMIASFIAASATAAKASFTSNRSMSSTDSFARSSTMSIAFAGAVVNHSGSCAAVDCATMRAIGLSPFFSA